MSSLASISTRNETLLVGGELNFESVMNVWEQSLPLLKQFSSLSFDFSGVTSANTAALALVVEWMKYARHYQKEIFIHHLPEQLVSIAKVANVESLFGGF